MMVIIHRAPIRLFGVVKTTLVVRLVAELIFIRLHSDPRLMVATCLPEPGNWFWFDKGQNNSKQANSPFTPAALSGALWLDFGIFKSLV